MSDNNIDLNSNFLDKRVASYTAIANMVPYLGPCLSAIISEIIPNQRVDRIVRYVELLNQKIEKIDQELIKNISHDENGIDLVEEGFVQASRAISNERREYIANLVVNGISDEKKKYSDIKYMLKLLSELNDPEIIWLRSYLHSPINGDEDFREKHKNILTVEPSNIGTDEATNEKNSIQNSYSEHLERLGLISSHKTIDIRTKQPKYDRYGNQEVSYRYTTILGKYLLKLLNLLPNE